MPFFKNYVQEIEKQKENMVQEKFIYLSLLPKKSLSHFPNVICFLKHHLKLVIRRFGIILQTNNLYSFPTGSSDGSWDKETLYSSPPQGSQASVTHPRIPGVHSLPVSHPLHHLQQSHLLPNGTMAFFSTKNNSCKGKKK